MNPASLKVNDTVDSKEIMSIKLDPFQDFFSTFLSVQQGHYVLFAMLLGFYLGGPSVAGRKELKYTRNSVSNNV